MSVNCTALTLWFSCLTLEKAFDSDIKKVCLKKKKYLVKGRVDVSC